jgi:hypothetical protein
MLKISQVIKSLQQYFSLLLASEIIFTSSITVAMEQGAESDVCVVFLCFKKNK